MISAETRQEILVFLSEASQKGCRQKVICQRIGIILRTVENWRKNGLKDQRKGAVKNVGNKLSEQERQSIIKLTSSERFRDKTPCSIVPILAQEGVYKASESTMYRILRTAGLIVRVPARPSLNTPVELTADGPNQLWSWDISYLKTKVRGQYYFLYLFMDVWSRAIMGWEIHLNESQILSSAMMERLCREHGIEKAKLTLHADNGGPMKNATMLATLQKLGVAESFSRPSVSDDNPFSESLFKTLKYKAGYPASFKSLEEAQEWVRRFVEWYNNEHRHSMIGFVTPMERHKGFDKQILASRKEVYETARLKNPERWSRHCRKWNWINVVELKKGNRKNKFV